MSKELESLTVIQDDNINTEDYINVYTSNKDTNFKKGMFVKISSENVLDYIWIGQIVTSNSNMCPAISKPTDQTMLSALEDKSQKKDVIDGFGIDVFFKVKLLKKCYTYNVNGKTYFDFEPIDSRPTFGSFVYKLETNEIFELLKVPKYIENNSSSNAIGYSQTITNLPLCLTSKEFHTHILVSGTTGSGKSNVNAHIIKIAQSLNKPVIIHDAKPDFSLIEFLNSESFSFIKSKRKIDQEKKYLFKEKGLKNVYKIGFNGIHTSYENSSAFYDAFIYFKPSDFTVNEFSNLFFFSDLDINQREEFSSILKRHYEDINTSKIEKSFDISSLLDHILLVLKEDFQHTNKDIFVENNDLTSNLDKINKATLKTIYQKITRRLISYPWLITSFSKPTIKKGNKDYNKIIENMKTIALKSEKANNEKSKIKIEEYYKNQKNEFFEKRSKLKNENLQKKDILSFIKEKLKTENSPIFLIDYDFKEADITYSFIINKLLKDIQSLQDSEEASENGIVQVIDEAHRLFSGLSQNFKDELMHSLSKVIKEGRVKKHSLVLSLQNASEIPDTALNNFGTKIALRQQSEQEAKTSTQGMGDNASKDVMNLSPGQFLIKYPSGEFTFLGFGFLSPFQLRVE